MSLSDADRELIAKRATKSADDCTRHLERLRRHLTKALSNLGDWGGIGYGSGQSGGGGSNKGSGHSDPSGDAAAAVLTREAKAAGVKTKFERDAFARDHARIMEGLVTAETALADVEKRVDRARALWLKGEMPTIATAIGCQPCSMVKDPATGREHENGYQEKYVSRPRPQNPGGPKVPYCRWHADFIAKWGEEPSEALVLWRLGHSGNITTALIKDHHPEAWARVQAEQSTRPLGLARLGLRTAESGSA